MSKFDQQFDTQGAARRGRHVKREHHRTVSNATKHKSSDPIEYRGGNATALPVESAEFDVAVSTQVIEYLADADAALREIVRVVRPGGRAFIVDTDFDSWIWHAADAGRMSQIMKGWETHCADPSHQEH